MIIFKQKIQSVPPQNLVAAFRQCVTTVEALPRNFNLVDVVHVDLKKMLVIK